jgi:hypothetical protein
LDFPRHRGGDQRSAVFAQALDGGFDFGGQVGYLNFARNSGE